MKLTAPRAALVKLVSRSADVVERKGPSFVASCVLIEAAEGRVELRSTDTILSLRVTGTATVARPGAIGVPAKELLDRLRALPEGDVDLEEDGPKLVVKQGRRRYTLKSVPPTEFPPFPSEVGRADFTLPSTQLASLLARTGFAMNADPAGKFHCTNLVLGGEQVRVDASDGHVMATVVEAGGPAANAATALPHRTALVLRRLLEAEDAPAHVLLSAGRVLVSSAGWTLVSPESPMPVVNLDKHLAEPPQHVALGKLRLVEAIKGILVAAPNVDLVAEGGTLTLSAAGGEEATDVLDVQGHEGAIAVRCACAHLLALLGAIEDAEVRVANGDPLAPIYLRGESAPGLAGRFIAMPIRKDAA